MTPQDVPKEIEHLKRFLLLRLVLVMLFVLVTEGVINLVFGHFALPVINSYFGSQMNWGQQASDTNILTLLTLAVYTILVGLSRGLPFGASGAVTYFLNKYMMGDINFVSTITDEQRVLLLMLVFVLLSAYILPYIIAILYYSGVVVKKMEDIREYDKKQQEEFTRKRNLLLSDITHDIKTPITTMAGYAQALNDGMVTDPEKQKRYLEAIRQKSLQMSELITLLFHYVKMDSEGFTLKKEKADLAELVLQVAAGAYTDIEEAGMELDVDIPEGPIYAQLDKAQFSRAVTNLVNNAIRHTDAGTQIKVCMTKEGSFHRIEVRDSGTPIEESILQNIFDPFVMGDESRNRRGGSGLGLSVTRKVIEMHGGKIFVEQPSLSPYTKSFCILLPDDGDYEY